MKFEVIFARVEWYPFRFRKFCCCGIDGAGDRNLGFGLGGFSGACRSTGNQGQVKRQKGSSSSTAQSKSEKVAADRLLSNQGQVKRQKGSSSYTTQQPRPSQKAKRQQQLYFLATKAKSKGKKVAVVILLSTQGQVKGKKVAAVILITAQQTAGQGLKGFKISLLYTSILCVFSCKPHLSKYTHVDVNVQFERGKSDYILVHLQSRVITEKLNELLTRPSSNLRQWN